MKYTSILVILLSIFMMVACKNQAETVSQEEEVMQAVDKTGKEYTSDYICPMHCKGSGSDHAGECPVCGMDYVPNDQNGHNHDDHDNHNGHDDHNHDEDSNHEGHDH